MGGSGIKELLVYPWGIYGESKGQHQGCWLHYCHDCWVSRSGLASTENKSINQWMS